MLQLTDTQIIDAGQTRPGRGGVDWQCQQLENAQYCLFEQKTLTGNGNYSVAIAQGVKISFAYHIQAAIFGKAYEKYGFNQSIVEQNINLDLRSDTAEGDFGHIGRRMKNPWDEDFSIFNGMKALGTDSIFVGHEHCNSASVVYEGVRFQFGQKSSE